MVFEPYSSHITVVTEEVSQYSTHLYFTDDDMLELCDPEEIFSVMGCEHKPESLCMADTVGCTRYLTIVYDSKALDVASNSNSFEHNFILPAKPISCCCLLNTGR